MTRKSSLLRISEVYSNMLEEMNVGIASQAQNSIPKDQDDETVIIRNATDPSKISFSVPQKQTSQEMSQIALKGDEMHNSCSSCETGQCTHSEEEECLDPSSESNLDMAKSEIFSISDDIKHLQALLSKNKKVEAWMLSKLVKAADFISSVKKVLSYSDYEDSVGSCMRDIGDGMAIVDQITSMLNGESASVNEAVLNKIILNLRILEKNE
jgi:hypothetical protein